jgi:hypothetical protein
VFVIILYSLLYLFANKRVEPLTISAYGTTEAIKMTHQPIENNNNEGRYKKQNSGNINDSNKSKKMRDEISDSE